MFEEAVRAAKAVFRVRRGQQQFPKLPFLFGGYDWPAQKLTLFQKVGQETVLEEVKVLYSGLLGWVTAGDEAGKEALSAELQLYTDTCLGLFAKRRIRLTMKTTDQESSYRLLARRQYNGPYLPIKCLNPQAKDLVSVFNSAVLSLDNRLCKLKHLKQREI